MAEQEKINRSARLNAERREIILEAARLVFDEKGLQGASIRAIAKAADCTSGAIYPYFKGKEEIYAEILCRSLVALQSYIQPRENQPLPAKQRFVRFIQYYVERPADFSLGLYLYDQGAPIGVGAEMNDKLNLLLLQAVRLAAYGDKEQEGDPRDVSVLLSTLLGLIIAHSTHRVKLFDMDVEEIAAEAFARLDKGGGDRLRAVQQ